MKLHLFCVFRPESPYRTNLFQDDFSGRHLFALRENVSEKYLSGTEYISLISDILKMKKNVCVCRHFQLLDKTAVAT